MSHKHVLVSVMLYTQFTVLSLNYCSELQTRARKCNVSSVHSIIIESYSSEPLTRASKCNVVYSVHSVIIESLLWATNTS